jgi:hypothetical protein
MKEYQEIVQQKGLPEVGQSVRSKTHGTLWRGMEKREHWQNIVTDAKTGETHMVPAIYLVYWRQQEGVQPGIGRMLGYLYTLYDNTFEANWEIAS